VGTATRPQLPAAQAGDYTILKYLEKAGALPTPVADNWNPTAGVGDGATFTPTYTVAATGGTHTTVQSAIDAAVAAGGTNRIYVLLMPGTYREIVCVRSTAPPITLYSTNPDATQTVIAFNNFAGQTTGTANPCNPTFGTSGSATFAAYGNGFQAKNLTISNDTNEAAVTGSLQAVALLTQGDKLVFENVRLLGNQDTLLAKTAAVTTVARSYFKGCYIEGDTDFICGRGTMVFDGCEIKYLTSRKTGGNVIAPSTDARNGYGILIINGTFTAEAGTAAGSIRLGRAWDESQVDVPTYTANVLTGIYPNGQAVIRDSMLGAHIRIADPWGVAATTSRAFSATATGGVPANRLYELTNTGAGAAP
jgi:pectinesterase